MDLVSPGYIGLKIIYIIVLLIVALLHYSLIRVDFVPPAYLAFKFIQIIVLLVYVISLYGRSHVIHLPGRSLFERARYSSSSSAESAKTPSAQARGNSTSLALWTGVE